MEWKKSKILRWTANGFTITEDVIGDGRPYRLESPDADDERFASLEAAKATAHLKNELAITKADNERLRAELAEVRGEWPDHIDFGESPEASFPPDDGRVIPLNVTH